MAKWHREQEYWQRFGLRLDPRPLEDRPWREVWEYDLILDERIKYESKPPQPGHGAVPSFGGGRASGGRAPRLSP